MGDDDFNMKLFRSTSEFLINQDAERVTLEFQDEYVV